MLYAGTQVVYVVHVSPDVKVHEAEVLQNWVAHWNVEQGFDGTDDDVPRFSSRPLSGLAQTSGSLTKMKRRRGFWRGGSRDKHVASKKMFGVVSS